MSREAVPKRKYSHYVYELPYKERKALCNILDINDKWEELGGMYMKFDCATLYKLNKAVMRNRSPSDELLCLWGTQNHTILDLFVLLSKMHHYQAMRILKPFVDPKYHHLIYEGEEHISQLMPYKNTDTLKDCENSTSVETRGSTEVSQVKHIVNNIRGNGVNVNVLNEGNVPGQKNKLAPIKEIVSKGLNNEQIQDVKEKPTYHHEKKSPDTSSSSGGIESCVPFISYKELEIATNNWDRTNILGKGGFGVVFKGTWKNTAVAIKRLEPQKGNELEFNVLEAQRQQSLKELRYLNTYRHDNILPLYGYSIGGEKSCLIYQYMPNGSLEDRLQCRHGTKPLNWILRHKIATGAARGLQFLHGIDKPLVHGDIKSANILLDPYFEPKIGDFGLAREGPLQQYTHVKVSRVHGTRPYLPDEFLRGKKFSTKVDTYSFGVVLFEIGTGLRAYDDTRQYKFLKDYVDTYEESRIRDIMDPKAGPDDAHTFPALIALGKWCIKQRPRDRPDMVQVLRQLDGMMTAREMANRAQLLMRQNSLTPSNPYEAQFLHDHHTQLRRVSISPSGSYHPQPWLFASLAVSNAMAAAPIVQPQNHRSPLPTQPIVTNGSPSAAVAAQPVFVGATNDVSPPLIENATAGSRVSHLSGTAAGFHIGNIHPLFPPTYGGALSANQNTSNTSLLTSTSRQNSNIVTTSNEASRTEDQKEEGNDTVAYNYDHMLPLISELKIQEDVTSDG